MEAGLGRRQRMFPKAAPFRESNLTVRSFPADRGVIAQVDLARLDRTLVRTQGATVTLERGDRRLRGEAERADLILKN